MKIRDVNFNKEQKSTTLIELKDLLSQPSDKKERPCPGCQFTTPDGRTDRKSTQYCSYRCPAAPQEMSSDPIRFPIEQGVVPLVYTIYTLRKLIPCWSCEGHLDGHHHLTKHPKVWFYSLSSFYPKLIAQALDQMETERLLSNDWIVKILPFSQSMYTITYSIEPNMNLNKSTGDIALHSLHSDLITIADNLRLEVFRQARMYIEKGELSPFNHYPNG